MAKRKGKSVSFDAMVKFFMHAYEIPTKHDIDRLIERLDRIERLITNSHEGKARRASATHPSAPKSGGASAGDAVMEIIRRHTEGVGLDTIREQTGFSEKKMRNVVFRLYQQGRIQRKSRGIYSAN
jgi:hypothetical protein